MNIKRGTLLVISLFLSIDCFSLISNWKFNRKEKAFEKYDNYSINDDNGLFTFSCTDTYLKTIHNSNNRGIKNIKSEISISAESISSIGLTTFEITEVGTESELAQVNVYSFKNQEGEQDGIIECCGATTTISEALAASNEIMEEHSIESIFESFTSVQVLITIADIALTIANYTQAESLASEFIDIPVFNLADPTIYLFYLAKIEIIKYHFSHNNQYIAKELEEIYHFGLIDKGNDQQNILWKNVKIGFSNIYESGCGIIAVYNALVMNKKPINFAALIALFEICGADLLFGVVAANPIPSDVLRILGPIVVATYAAVLQPILNFALATISPLIYSATSPLNLVVPLAGEAAATTIIADISVLINTVSAAVEQFLLWYSSYLRSEEEILELIFFPRYIHSYPMGTWTLFKNSLDIYGQGIAAFWFYNENRELQSAHFVYVYRIKTFGKIKYIAPNNSDGDNTYEDPLDIFSCGKRKGEASDLLWGYTFNE